jgi:hypothetical protein
MESILGRYLPLSPYNVSNSQYRLFASLFGKGGLRRWESTRSRSIF